ncbi:hypothetical protein BHE74_00043816 [Ensete ventricosum]|nr:hypothetical protein GW17_00041932 [Ensete ventricosum]RWW49971.1 hypothetical protein BHE74_00043816 [Ensete ventricosum]
MASVVTEQLAGRPAAFAESIACPTLERRLRRQAQMARRSSALGVRPLTAWTPLQHCVDSDGSSPVTYGTHIPNAVCATAQSECVFDDAHPMATARIAATKKRRRRAIRLLKQQRRAFDVGN